MKKKKVLLISIIIALISLIAFIPTVRGYTVTQDGLHWYYNLTGRFATNVRIDSNYPAPSGTVSIPSTLNGYTVLELGSYVFQSGYTSSNYTVTKVIIPDTVTKIKDNAFYYCGYLKEVIIPNSVTEIGNYAFIGCKALKKVTIPSSVTQIHMNAFQNVKDLFIDNTEDNVNIDYTGVSASATTPNIHYKGTKHTLEVDTVNGLKITNVETGEKVTQEEVTCQEDVTYRLEQEENKYTDEDIWVLLESQDSDGNLVTEKLEWNIGETYTIRNVTKNMSIYVQEKTKERSRFIIKTIYK